MALNHTAKHSSQSIGWAQRPPGQMCLAYSAPEDGLCFAGASVAPGEGLTLDFATSLFSAQAPAGWSRRPALVKVLFSPCVSVIQQPVGHCSSSVRWGAMPDSTDRHENLGP